MIISENLLYSFGAELQQYNAGDFIFEEGSTPKYYLQIKSGTVKLSSFLEDGKEFIYGIPFEGHCIAETYLFHHKKYALNSIAVTDCEIIRLEKEKFSELLSKNPEIIFKVYAYTADRMHYRYLTSAPFSSQNSSTKLIILLDHIKNYFGFTEKFSYPIPYTRQQLASLTGLRIETVIRTIKKMERDEIVRIDNGKIYY